MGRTGANIAVAAFLFVCLAGCNSASKHEEAARRQQQATDGIARLRTAYNSGACQSVYDLTLAWSRSDRSRAYWVDLCTNMREKLGLWQSFRGPSSTQLEGNAALVESRVVFANGEFRMDTYWHLDGHGAQLVGLDLYDNHGQQVLIPPMAPFWDPGRRLMDPPPRGSETSA